uniref:Putative LAGLIDADG homing endonuclease n=2 Tax=Ignatiaceae TaxID=2682551 RepID=A0A1W6EGU3_9CHLO|nr:putative LAGLIDADG homing endonuclease [Pseudocharacium americanum]YP_009367673.1 putative LAGLIDADG homing endonuclease [Ignatius tetrasporus]ARK14624.1 putative LAGLIDADG homing endonuclease [Pseudocharacium americanum]ARK14719.1 putative LAGLIDADG homing endonuclease [Ignatius tetrasporus]
MVVNQPPSCGSSETTRKAPLLVNFYKYGHAPHVPRISECFLEWFIGFFEGDGSFFSYFENATTQNIRLKATIVQKEKKIITTIQQTFGFGNLSSFEKNGTTYWRWVVESKPALERLAFLFSGNLILPKRQKQFLNWIDLGQKKGMFQYPFDRNQPWTAKVSLNNGWLSGFIDAEGCFYASFQHSFNKINSSYKLKQKMTLTQRDINGGEEAIFQQILYLLETPQKKIARFHKSEDCATRNPPNHKIPFSQSISIAQSAIPPIESIDSLERPSITPKSITPSEKLPIKQNSIYIRIEIWCLKSQEIVINYLLKYKLRTQKYIAFRRWWRVYLRRKEGIHLSEKGIQRLWRLVKSINIHTKQLVNEKQAD